MFKILYDKFGTEEHYPKIDQFNMFKLKTDLKETSFAPYKLAFNYQVLLEKQAIYTSMGRKEDARDAYTQYLLPDGETTITIEAGETEAVIIDQMMGLYSNSNLLKKKWKGSNTKEAKRKNTLSKLDVFKELDKENDSGMINETKSLQYKVLQMMDKYCKDESVNKYNVENVFVTGGSLVM